MIFSIILLNLDLYREFVIVLMTHLMKTLSLLFVNFLKQKPVQIMPLVNITIKGDLQGRVV